MIKTIKQSFRKLAKSIFIPSPFGEGRVGLLLLFLPMLSFAQSPKAKQAALTLTTYRADGTVIAQAPGVFVSRDGVALSAWTPFKDAVRAEVKDSKGRTLKVDCLYGANALYNVARFRVASVTDAAALTPSATAQKQGTTVYVMGLQPQKTAVSSTEQFAGSYTYTVLESITAQTVKDHPEQYDGAAVVTERGDLIGLYNYSSSVQSSTDARFANAFTTTALSASDATLRQTAVRIALPPTEKDAQLALMLAADRNNDYQQATARDFIAAFPTSLDGYNSMANALVRVGNCQQADATMKQALQKVSNKAEAHHAYSRLIAHYLTNVAPYDTTGTTYTAWTWDLAKTEADAAVAANNQPLYRQQVGIALIGQQKYQEAYDYFTALSSEKSLQGEPYYQAFIAKAQLGGTNDELLQLLTSAINASDTAAAANYFYARAVLYDNMGKYREAMRDYIVYENLDYAHLTAAFYYQREQCERKGKFWQTALEDIAHAVLLHPRNADYWGEWASLALQLGRYDDAEKAADGCLRINAEAADALLIKGIAQCEQGNKAEGRKNIQLAADKGNEQAAGYLKKYK